MAAANNKNRLQIDMVNLQIQVHEHYLTCNPHRRSYLAAMQNKSAVVVQQAHNQDRHETRQCKQCMRALEE